MIPFLFTFYGFYNIAFTPLRVAYPCEIWQFNLHARGLATTLLSTQAAVFFNSFVNPIALGAIAWKYYIIYCVILVFITVTIYFCYPETMGHSLEEMTRVFEGRNAAVVLQKASLLQMSWPGSQRMMASCQMLSTFLMLESPQLHEQEHHESYQGLCDLRRRYSV
ncbi:hypothetical protein LTS15_010951 [Exophiala xenobiotica]|nr:hypothetical protein LTS15_010951 [Exophiala xenobiotica]